MPGNLKSANTRNVLSLEIKECIGMSIDDAICILVTP